MNTETSMMMMSMKNEQVAKRTRSIGLVLIMLLSIAASATFTSASITRSYTTNRDPEDIAFGDFDCDGDLDIALATEGTHSMSVLWNDNGDFSQRDDIWVAGNQSHNAEWEEFAWVRMVETGDVTGDGIDDIVIFQRNNPFRTDDSGQPAGQPGNVTVLENDGCDENTFSVKARFTHFWAWDLAVDDVDKDGTDDIVVLDLLPDLTTQRLVTYRGPITSSNQQGTATNLGASTQERFIEFELGDFGETETNLGGQCTDLDVWFLVLRGANYQTGQYTTFGHDDNLSVMEYSCLTNTFPATSSTTTMNGPWAFGNGWGGFNIADINGDGDIDVMAQTQENTENVTYRTSSTSGTWSSTSQVYIGPYITYEVTIADLNGDGEADFINPTIAEQINSTSSSGSVEGNYYLTPPSTVQVTLSDGSGGHLNSLSYNTGRRPLTAEVGQLVGGASSPLDIVIGHTSYNFGNWVDNAGWGGQYDTITIVEMDNIDLEVSSIDITPVDRYIGAVGEGQRDVNVTVTNTGMNVLNGQATLTLEMKVVDEANSQNQTVYAYDWDGAESKSGCGGGCNWAYEDYLHDGNNWHLETNHSTGLPSASMGNNDVNSTANWTGNNPTNFMWDGVMKTNDSGVVWSGYDRNWDEAMVLEDVDLSGSDRAWLSVELFRHLGFGALGSVDANNQWLLGDLWDDVAMVEIYSEERGWSTINCPTSAFLDGACWSGSSIWGGYDRERVEKIYAYGAAAESNLWYGIRNAGTYYGWSNFTEEGVGAFDLSPWAGQTVDIRFRLRTGFEGSVSSSDDQLWQGRDGYAIDNVTIWKQNTAFTGSPQTQQSNINMNNLQPGEEYEASIQANFANDTTYRISATLSYGPDQQPINDELTGYISTLNIFDPSVVSIDSFEPGATYAEGVQDIIATVAHYGNTRVDFDVQATIYSAMPNDINCGPTPKTCEEDFEGGENGYRYTDDNSGDGQGVILTDSGTASPLFNGSAYWFGHHQVSANLGYEDVWNESFALKSIDLTAMQGDFASLSFDYFAETFFYIDLDGSKYEVNDYVALGLDWDRAGVLGDGIILGQWNDFNEDGTCFVDEDGDGFIDPINETEIDQKEITFIGDPTNNQEDAGNYNVFFDSEGAVKSQSIDLTHLYILNQTAPNGNDWNRECMSLKGTMTDVSFDFQSDDDGHNGLNDGLRGIGFDNIVIKEFSFIQDAVVSSSVSGLDAEGEQKVTIGSHDFNQGVYMVEVESIFDNTTAGTSWYGEEEFNDANNIERIIFSIQSVTIDLKKGNDLYLDCLDADYACSMPKDNSTAHEFSFLAVNGVLEGDYLFNHHVVDMDTGVEVYSAQEFNGQSKHLIPQERVDLTFSGFNGWVDGHTYNISFDAELTDGTPKGDPLFFYAKFETNIDVAILTDEDEQNRYSNILRDLEGLGMSYTKFPRHKWDTYLTNGWLNGHYGKVLIPWQKESTAQDAPLGSAFYDNVGDYAETLELFTTAGGTLQMHLGPYQNAIEDELPFNIDIQDRTTAEKEIAYEDLEINDPYHPILENVERSNLQGFTTGNVFASAILYTIPQGGQEIPNLCGGTIDSGGEFLSIMGSKRSNYDSILSVCGAQEGGIIISTIDVEAKSDAWNSTTPLLANMLKFQVTKYPQGFDEATKGFDITVNGKKPDTMPSDTTTYDVRAMKSDAHLEFGYTTTTTSAVLNADWELTGPTGWEESDDAHGTFHSADESPSADFCVPADTDNDGQVDDCAQGETWVLKLFLHDDAGHARIASLTLVTDDASADEFKPFANYSVVEETANADFVTFRENKPGSDAWELWQIELDEDAGDQTVVNFDASASFDPDALDGHGIKTYIWTVIYDWPIDGDEGDDHVFSKFGYTDGEFSYTFRNVTVGDHGFEQQIRIELQVIDQATRASDVHKIYFVVVEPGHGDSEPKVTLDQTYNNTGAVTGDWFNVSGLVESGVENDDLEIIVALSLEDRDQDDGDLVSSLRADGKWNQALNLGNSDTFELSLNISDLYTNKAEKVRIYVKIVEGDRWVILKYIDLNLPACKGVSPPVEAISSGGEWLLNTDGECEWSGEWEYDAETGEWSEPKASGGPTDNPGDDSTLMMLGAGGVILLIVILLTVLVLRRGDDDEDESGFGSVTKGYAGIPAVDPMEAYVQQLIAQGYPEETARAYAQQYAAHFQQQATAQQPGYQ